MEKYCDFSNLKTRNTGGIDWANNIGASFDFVYDDIIGSMKICDFKRDTNKKLSYALIEYDNTQKWFNVNDITGMKFAQFIGHKRDYSNRRKRKSIQKYNVGDVITNKFQKIKIVGVGLSIPKNGLVLHGNPNCKSEIIYYCLCSECGCHFKKPQPQLSQNSKCPICDGKIVVPGINDITTTDPWMIDYFQNGIEEASKYCSHSNKSIIPRCPICGDVYDKLVIISNIKKYNGIHCPCLLKDTYPEKYMSSLLNQLDIKYIQHHCLERKLYDFYLPDYNTIIETHGIQHFEECGLSQIGRSLQEEQENDRLKEKIASDHGIRNYFAIDCRHSSPDWIKKNIIDSGLLSIINKSNKTINWEECNVYANTSIYTVCKDYMDNISIDDLVIKYERRRTTILKYLREGNKHGWCDYRHNKSRSYNI